MKASDSTNSLTALQPDVEESLVTCFICLEECNDKQEPLVDSSLLRTCGCRFKVHPDCWNAWMKDKTDYDCPICRKKSLTLNKPPTPMFHVVEDWNQQTRGNRKRLYALVCSAIVFAGGFIMAYKIATE